MGIGGILNQTMETGSFAGGNSLNWPQFVEELQNTTNIKVFRNVPTSAQLGITFREAFSANKTDVPREFWRLSPDFHSYDLFPPQRGDVDVTNETQYLADLYEAALGYFERIPPGLPGGNGGWTLLDLVFGMMCLVLVIVLLLSIALCCWYTRRQDVEPEAELF